MISPVAWVNPRLIACDMPVSRAECVCEIAEPYSSISFSVLSVESPSWMMY